MPIPTNPIANPNLANLPKGSLLRLYDPTTQGNSFSLDGFPALKPGKDWLTRLVEIIEGWGAVGMTTNQTIFRQLIETGALDERLRGLKAKGQSTQEIYQILYNEAATQAAKSFSAIHARWPWEGRVSQEASAFLTELDPLVKDVQRIAAAMKGVGAFTKIPNLKIGPQAIEKAVAAQGLIHPNVTLVFSDRHYLDTVEGYLLGLKARANRGEEISRIYSVNSLFVSRVDRVVDPMILRQASFDAPFALSSSKGEWLAQDERLRLLKGKVAVAQAKKVYEIFQAIFLGTTFNDPEGLYADEEGQKMKETIRRLQGLFAELRQRGAHPQRLLIASSGVKSDQPYSPLLYVLPFLGPWSANTMPEGTLEAFSRFVAGLSDDQVAALKGCNLMREALPAIPADIQPVSSWDQAILATSEERKRRRIGEVTPDRILLQAHDLIFKPQGTSLRALCDTLRDKGAQAFTADEQATLETIQAKLQTLML